jgi:polar amino acid transport system substrate-binding protein
VLPAINAVTLPDVQNALTQLASRRIDGVLADTSQSVWAQRQQPNTFTLLTPKVDTRSDNIAAVGFKKGSALSPALQRAVQSVLDGPENKESLTNWRLQDSVATEAKLN